MWNPNRNSANAINPSSSSVFFRDFFESKREWMNATNTAICLEGLNSLTDNVYESIISHLPMKDAISTSLISKDWKYRWRSTPSIIFDEYCFPRVKEQDLKDHERNIINFINNVMILHDGSIQKFVFSAALRDCSSMDTWIYALQKKGVKSCMLSFPRKSDYKVHSNLFCCSSLTNLVLCNCIVKLPPCFRGFSSLRSLQLFRVKFVNSSDIKFLISNCQLLEELELVKCTGFSSLKIHSPKLLSLELSGFCINLYIDFAPLMSFLSINLSCGTANSHYIGCKESHSVFAFLKRLPEMRRLEMSAGFLEHLSCCRGKKTYAPHTYMDSLSIDLNFSSSKGFEVFRWLLCSCPELTKLHIKSCCATEWASSTTEIGFNFGLELFNLQILILDKMVGIEAELKFMEYVLGNAPALEEVHFTLRGDIKGKPHKVQELLKRLLSFRRASRSAQIYWKDESKE